MKTLVTLLLCCMLLLSTGCTVTNPLGAELPSKTTESTAEATQKSQSKKSTTTSTSKTTTIKKSTKNTSAKPTTTTEKATTTTTKKSTTKKSTTKKKTTLEKTCQYVDYRCVDCGEVQEGYEIDYLKHYILENGETKGSYCQLYAYHSDCTTAIAYDANEDIVYLSYAETANNGEIFYLEIVLNKNFSHKYYCDYAKQSTLRGNIDAKTFTDSTPLPCREYIGDENYRNKDIESTRLIAVYLLDWTKEYLKKADIGITLKDLGFKKY